MFLPILLLDRPDGAPVFVVPEGIDAVAVASGIAAAWGEDARALAFAGGILEPAETRAVLARLRAGGRLVWGCAPGTRASPILNLADGYAGCCRNPNVFNTVSDVWRSLPPASTEPGTLVVVVPRAAWGEPRGELDPFFLAADDAAALAAAGAVHPAEATGRAPHLAPRTSIREVFLLPHRDPVGTRVRLVDEIVATDGAFTWTDFAVVLRAIGVRNAYWAEARGRLGDEQWAFLLAFGDLLDVRQDTVPRGVTIHVAGDVWEMAWDRPTWLDPRLLYRGQFDAGWPLRPTLLRAGGAAPSTGELATRMASTRRFVRALRARSDELFARPPTDLELVAVAQHYGFPTPLLDFTRAHSVAAFFASFGARDMPVGTSRVGVVYSLSPERGATARLQEIAGLNPFELAGVAPGAVTVVEPPLRPEDDRPGRQQGAFVTGHRLSDLRRLLTDTWYFHQRPGEVFEDPLHGVDAATLLPDGGALAALAAECSRRARRARPIGGLDDIALYDHDVVGSVGDRLGWHVNHQPALLAALDVRLAAQSEAVAGGVRAAIDGFFAAARAESLALPVPPPEPGKPAQKPLYVAYVAIGEALGVSGTALWRLVGQLEEADRAGRHSRVAEAASALGPNGGLAVAAALLLLAWDTLRRVDGDHAADLVLLAETV
jgi:hypothetical protein